MEKAKSIHLLNQAVPTSYRPCTNTCTFTPFGRSRLQAAVAIIQADRDPGNGHLEVLADRILF